ncbi:Septum formation inhibitor-activating ATPase [Brevundimonas diminuta]|uniref:division plane positioning ATPase MipZ n=1 Tax=Brevundimonas diminuta TaxID=293 RepID=UPI000207F40B|nr:division plane positioning ATPase MipZ [Brevundimonas diminuta]EGF94919.1 ATPase MipZ family protein [Brevundimonas diminuta ATCC 11568]OWR24445.1 ATPase [Brevundimonas diminuta]WQE46298.1 division plane positioning ATPase MipZ [Brevundimonas diminuta]SPU48246.1 Septum formation inhibitor-activating ATPase [Brevundimonas diminuta]SUW15549.1 Septum formation inhibitor-activating ATPase [Brevundimonas diminuta]
MAQPQVIVIGNEKGGAGKSTLAIHIVTGLLHAGRKVAIIDLDLRQRSMERFFANRVAWTKANGHELPLPFVPDMGDGKALHKADETEQLARFEAAYAEAKGVADVIVIDTPGGDTALSRAAHGRADQIVTPMNDSFVDFDLLGEVDPVTLDLVKPSIYSESVWEARKHRAITEGRQVTIDWIVVTNRLAVAEARNRRRLASRMAKLAKRVGFRVGPGLRDRVIYRELFPFGLTVADLSNDIRPVSVSLAHVAARQEMRNLMQALGLDDAIAAMDAAA